MKISTFYSEEYIHSAMYQSFRTSANYIDGLKNGMRKIVYTIDKNSITNGIKVSQLCSKVAEETEYLHGEGALYSTIVGLAQTYPGSNNLNILHPEGNFGNRLIHEASAGRYIYTKKSKYFDLLFSKLDREILTEQEFEGRKIEPKFYVPILPFILLNGSEGIGNGFAQKILQRDEKDLIKIIQEYLKGKKIPHLVPSVKGFGGKISLSDENKVLVEGKYDVINTNTIKITEIPFTYDLQGYLKVLDDLEDKKIIKGYRDLSENDVFEFEIDCTREFTKTDKDDLMKTFKLIKSVTENFTCIDENNAIVEFKDERELLVAYAKIRLEYYVKRKKHILAKLESENVILKNKIAFIEAVIDGKIILSNKSKEEIEKQVTKLKIKKIDGDYDYLLRMALYSLTKEKYEELKKIVADNEKKIEVLTKKTEKDLWNDDLEELKKSL